MKDPDFVKKACFEFLTNSYKHNEPGHDLNHLIRVFNLAARIARSYSNANINIITASALLHDMLDHKFIDAANNKIIEKNIFEFLITLNFSLNEIGQIFYIIKNISFSKNHRNLNNSIEFAIVQDADRLDAIGAIGIARAFSYGGFNCRPMFTDSYNLQIIENSTIAHFYEKLFLLRDLMNTPEAKTIADKKHKFMNVFLEEFKNEWFFAMQV